MLSVFGGFLGGKGLLGFTADTATRILLTRGYPEELVRAPIPDAYDLRVLTPLTIDMGPQALAKRVFNLKLAGDETPVEDVIGDEFSPQYLAEAWMSILVMFGHKINAIRNVTGVAPAPTATENRRDAVQETEPARSSVDALVEPFGWPSQALELLGESGAEELHARVGEHGECGVCHRQLGPSPRNYTVIDFLSVGGVGWQPDAPGTRIVAVPTHPTCSPATWVAGRGAQAKVSPDASWTAMAVATELRRVPDQTSRWRRKHASATAEDRMTVAAVLVNPSIDVLDVLVAEDGTITDCTLANFAEHGFTPPVEWGNQQPQAWGARVTKNTSSEIYVTFDGGEWSCDSGPELQAIVEAQGGIQVFVAVRPLTTEVELARSLEPLRSAAESSGLVLSCWAPLG